ncbi:uncharacterized protein LOC119919465 isoform X2 [Tachyglossus aculeatus]|uniref:uncharacterized protein LOC119919465 isoform X2 n=1 Tax=Tachyglossus aculeatus TaxID=9261 RepID=UPI0018F43089|nr:uncharacterized protein LOC119919465 isoform X2 [Tachyglossus aculeatus]
MSSPERCRAGAVNKSQSRRRLCPDPGGGCQGETAGSGPSLESRPLRRENDPPDFSQEAEGSGEAEDPPQLTPPPAELLGQGPRKVVLHVDLNNTILVSDSIMKQGPLAALNNYLSTVCWGKLSQTGEWQWLSYSPSLLPPSPNAVNFYTQFGRDPRFTDGKLGHPFQRLLAHHLRLLEWSGQPDRTFSIRGEDGKEYHWILPSFFHLLETLLRQGRHFAVVFRTFGQDLPPVLQAMHSALKGHHPHFPALREMAFPTNLFPGRIQCSTREIVISRGAERVSSRPDGREMYRYFSSMEGLGGFRDHFEWWSRNNFSSRGGKPLWIDPHDPQVQHICFDDNIRLQDSDSIIRPQGMKHLLSVLSCDTTPPQNQTSALREISRRIPPVDCWVKLQRLQRCL